MSEDVSDEEFESEAAAEQRTTYLETIAETGGPFAEYDYREGRVLLRVAGDVKPSQARRYSDALP